MEIKLLEIAGVKSALLALHLPYGKECGSNVDGDNITISFNDAKLLKKLISSGDEHAKVVRGIVAYFEIKAPRYFWQEFATYKIGCETLSSESTMHIQGKGLSEDELVRMKSELPEGTLQRRIVMLSYQTLRRIHHQRHNHRLPEWREFCDFLETLPYGWMICDNG